MRGGGSRKPRSRLKQILLVGAARRRTTRAANEFRGSSPTKWTMKERMGGGREGVMKAASLGNKKVREGKAYPADEQGVEFLGK